MNASLTSTFLYLAEISYNYFEEKGLKFYSLYKLILSW